jgi:hypothetical protein
MNNTPLTEGDDTEEASEDVQVASKVLSPQQRNNSPAVKRKPFANDDLLTDWRKPGPMKKKKEKENLEHKEKGKVRNFLHGLKEETKKKEKPEKIEKAAEKVEKTDRNDKKEDPEKKKTTKPKKTSTKSRYNNISSRSKWIQITSTQKTRIIL